MEETKPAQRTSSRTLAIGAVVLLIVVAIAGIMLAGRNKAPALGTAAALPDAPRTPPATGTPQPMTAPTAPAAPNPNEVVFATGSDKLPADANDILAKFSERARAGGMVRLTARFLTGANKAKDLELGKTRTAAVRHALVSNGVKPEQMQYEMIEMPAGVLAARDADRIELSLR